MTAIHQYTAAVYEADEGGYWADVLDLPGCVAQASTLEELQRNLREAIQAWEETQRELDGGRVERRRVLITSILAEEPAAT
jgi:predicted RNase H-like HicB family nuclease